MRWTERLWLGGPLYLYIIDVRRSSHKSFSVFEVIVDVVSYMNDSHADVLFDLPVRSGAVLGCR